MIASSRNSQLQSLESHNQNLTYGISDHHRERERVVWNRNLVVRNRNQPPLVLGTKTQQQQLNNQLKKNNRWNKTPSNEGYF